MEELLELRQFLEQGKIHEALLLVDELEEMSLGDKINKIDSYGVILLIHLIKQKAENRSTRSWDRKHGAGNQQNKQAPQIWWVLLESGRINGYSATRISSGTEKSGARSF